MWSDRRQALLLGCAVALFLAGFHRGSLSGGDEFGVYETTRAIAERGSLEVPAMQHVYPGRDGRLFHQYAVGQALLCLPFYALGAWGEAHLPRSWVLALTPPVVTLKGQPFPGEVAHFTVGLFAPFATGVLVAIFYAFQRHLGTTRRTATALGLLLGCTTYLAVISTFLLRHPTETVLILAAFLCFHRFASAGRVRLLAGGCLLLALTVLVRVPAGLAALPLGAHVLWCLRARWRAPGGLAPLRAAAAVALPALAVLAVHLYLNQLRWGSLFESPMFAERARFGTPLALSGWAYLFSPGMSVFVYSPLLLLAPAALVAWWRRQPAETAVVVAYAALFWLVFSRYDSWTGLWSAPGPRYLYSLVPLLLLPLGVWLDSGGRGRWAAALALGALGFVLQIALMETNWPRTVGELQYATYDPPLGFLFYPLTSPPYAALVYWWAGLKDDTWIAALATAWPALPIRPWVATALTAAWAATLLALLAALARGAGRRAP